MIQGLYHMPATWGDQLPEIIETCAEQMQWSPSDQISDQKLQNLGAVILDRFEDGTNNVSFRSVLCKLKFECAPTSSH